MTFYKIFHILCTAALAVAAVACDEANDGGWNAATPTADDCMQVYFSKDNPSEFIFAPEQTERSFDVVLCRQRTEGAADVPLTVTAEASRLQIPQTAHFDDGAAETLVHIALADLPDDTSTSFALALPEAYADHYTALPGSTTFSANVAVVAWRTIVSAVNMTWSVAGRDLVFNPPIQQLGSLNRYRIPDFLGSGLDMVFTLGNDSRYTGYYSIVPFANYVVENDGTATAFWLYDDAEDDYPVWTPSEGVETTGICFLTDYDGTKYSYISFDKRGGSFETYYTLWNADGAEGYDYYNYVNFTWGEEAVVK